MVARWALSIAGFDVTPHEFPSVSPPTLVLAAMLKPEDPARVLGDPEVVVGV